MPYVLFALFASYTVFSFIWLLLVYKNRAEQTYSSFWEWTRLSWLPAVVCLVCCWYTSCLRERLPRGMLLYGYQIVTHVAEHWKELGDAYTRIVLKRSVGADGFCKCQAKYCVLKAEQEEAEKAGKTPEWTGGRNMTYESGRGQVTIDAYVIYLCHIVIRAADLTTFRRRTTFRIGSAIDVAFAYGIGLFLVAAAGDGAFLCLRVPLWWLLYSPETPVKVAVYVAYFVALCLLDGACFGSVGFGPRIVIDLQAMHRVCNEAKKGQHTAAPPYHLCDPWVQRLVMALRYVQLIVGICHFCLGITPPGVVSILVYFLGDPLCAFIAADPMLVYGAFFGFIHAAQMLVMGITIFLFVDEYTLASRHVKGSS